MVDKRDPEQLGNLIMQLKEVYPDKAAPERADLIEDWLSKGVNFPSKNGK